MPSSAAYNNLFYLLLCARKLCTHSGKEYGVTVAAFKSIYYILRWDVQSSDTFFIKTVLFSLRVLSFFQIAATFINKTEILECGRGIVGSTFVSVYTEGLGFET